MADKNEIDLFDMFNMFGNPEPQIFTISSLKDYIKAETNLGELEARCMIEGELEGGEKIHSAYEEQKKIIEEFQDSYKAFDSTILYNNINYLLKKHNMRIGTLEGLLKISTGYIAKTVKPGSAKNISIDVVWKIAKIFNVDIKVLVETDMAAPGSDYQLLMNLVSKLTEKTATKEIHWDIVAETGKDYYSNIARTVVDPECDVPAYLDSRVVKEQKVLIDGKVYATDFATNQRLLILAYIDGVAKKHYEVYLVNCNPYDEEYEASIMFNTTQEKTGELEKSTDALYKCIGEHDNDLHVTDTMKDSINDFLSTIDLPFN